MYSLESKEDESKEDERTKVAYTRDTSLRERNPI